MRTIQICCGIALACVWASSQACDLPKLVVIPPADKISGHEKEVSSEVGVYFAAMHQYVDCVKEELRRDGGKHAPALVKALLVQRNNLAVAEANAVVKWYKQSTGSKPKKGLPKTKR